MLYGNRWTARVLYLLFIIFITHILYTIPGRQGYLAKWRRLGSVSGFKHWLLLGAGFDQHNPVPNWNGQVGDKVLVM